MNSLSSVSFNQNEWVVVSTWGIHAIHYKNSPDICCMEIKTLFRTVLFALFYGLLTSQALYRGRVVHSAASDCQHQLSMRGWMRGWMGGWMDYNMLCNYTSRMKNVKQLSPHT